MRWLFGLLIGCTALLWLTAIPEVFTIDDCNYLATVQSLRAGSLFVPGTEGLSPSSELVSFDPTATIRIVDRTPVTSTAPPLYAPLALPFSYLGWRWLILINTLSFAVTGWMVFQLGKLGSKRKQAPWIAVAVYVLGGFCLDYAQGMWPHMLSVALATSAVWLACRARREERVRLAVMAGVLAGLAAGVRYQNVVLAAALGLSIVVLSRRRLPLSLAFGAGAALPLLASGSINAVRLGSFNPITKGTGYLTSSAGVVAGRSAWLDTLWTLWVRVFDYSAHPAFGSDEARAALPKVPGTGVFLVVGGLKKALLQSAPWIALALVLLFAAWTPWLPLKRRKRGELRAVSFVVFAMLALFAWAGLERHDGWSFNQRYLLEVVPLCAVAVAWVVGDWELDRSSLVIGGAAGAALALVPIVAVVPEHWFRQRTLMYLPLALAAVLVACWLAARRQPGFERARLALLAATVAWALAVHVGDDVQAARGLRDWHGFQRRAIGQHLPDAPAALIAGLGQKEALCPLHLEYDLVMIDPVADRGATTGRLTQELLGSGRRVFVVGGLSESMLQSIFATRAMSMMAAKPIPMAEVLARPAPNTPAPAR